MRTSLLFATGSLGGLLLFVVVVAVATQISEGAIHIPLRPVLGGIGFFVGALIPALLFQKLRDKTKGGAR